MDHFTAFEQALSTYIKTVTTGDPTSADMIRARSNLRAALDLYVEAKAQKALDDTARRANTQARGTGRI